jgi:hypothetical protein
MLGVHGLSSMAHAFGNDRLHSLDLLTLCINVSICRRLFHIPLFHRCLIPPNRPRVQDHRRKHYHEIHHHHDRIARARQHVKTSTSPYEGEIVEDATRTVDRNEWERESRNPSEPPDLDVLRDKAGGDDDGGEDAKESGRCMCTTIIGGL